MGYKCIVAEDNAIERQILSVFLQKINDIEITAECEDGLEVVSVLKDQPIDIVFCDIDMPDLDGIGLLKSLRNPPVFIFITSFADYAVESWSLNVIDFILKPVKFDRLLQAVNKAIEYMQVRSVLDQQKSTADNNADNLYTDEHFFIKEAKGVTKLRYTDVLYIESMGDFSKIITTHNHSHIVLASLKNVLEQLPAAIFKRVHKQYIVNLEKLQTVTSAEVYLRGDAMIPLSNLYRQELLDVFVNKDLIKRKVE